MSRVSLNVHCTECVCVTDLGLFVLRIWVCLCYRSEFVCVTNLSLFVLQIWDCLCYRSEIVCVTDLRLCYRSEFNICGSVHHA